MRLFYRSQKSELRSQTAARCPLISALWIFTALLPLFAISARAADDDMKIEAQLIWATNDKEDPNPKHKPVAADIREKLKELPLKWSNYFEVNKVAFDVSKTGSHKVKLSEKCEIEIKNVDGSDIEISLLGKTDPLWKREQALPKGEILILGGNAPNATAWLVALKRTK